MTAPVDQAARDPTAYFPDGAKRTLRILRSRYPHTFNAINPKPLMLGVHYEIREEEGFSELEIGQFMNAWTTMPAYQRALAAPGSKRHYLAGDVWGPVSEDHRARAIQQLDERRWATFRAVLIGDGNG